MLVDTYSESEGVGSGGRGGVSKCRDNRYSKIDKHLARHLSITVGVFQIPLPFYTVKYLPLFQIQ